ncbi:dynamin family protein [Stutzerimonas stutzeri]|uniref:dynamin family protein n=1 Tax=Stutzerimonas stutzeri TaxID=316 RepID=UPI0024B6B9EC|nr:dynamin family protein [Stutzerimonas stutzeri]MDI9727867.1 dynamin family protein [Stutzerimonas stutzeri]MDI9747529.1 dynamin family protein [Stutzerimonas stutzeri]
MSDLLLTPQLEPALTRLKSIWPWGRKGLIEQLQQHITAADEHTVRMQALRQSIEAELARVNAELARAESDLEQWQSQHEQLQAAHSAQTQQLLERSIAYETLQETHKQLQLEYETLGNTAALIESRYNLVCNILNSKPAENAALSELKGWLAGEFARDVQRLELPADVTSPALEQANAIGLHVELLSDSPALRTKFLVAVAGGFSSGKSSFVTSFMRKEYSQLLAKGIQPVTAIPTYVMPGNELSIYGHTSKGAHVQLSKDEYAQLTHDFIANMGFSVKEIMPHVVIESPMPGLKHLAFIDMPGYDPAASDTADTAADHAIASAALSEADAVIWLVALDSNGTLPANDLEFLLQHADDRPLYVVLNKADLRPLANLEAVIEEIKEHLEDSGIQFEGICAYSSTLAKELLHEGKSLSEVMNEWDHLSDAALVLHKDFDTLVTTLEKHSSQQLHKVEMVGELAHSLELDILEIAGSESTVFQTAQSRIKQLKELAESIFGTERSEVSRALENMRLCGHKLLQANFGQLTAPSQRNEAFTD